MAKEKPISEQLTQLIVQEAPNLSSNKARKIVRMVQQRISIHSGPYPKAEEYEHYYDIDPDLTAQMKQMVKDEQKHQHELDKLHMEKSFTLRKRGQWFGFFIFLSVTTLGGYIAYTGSEWPGTLITISGVSGIIVQYLKG